MPCSSKPIPIPTRPPATAPTWCHWMSFQGCCGGCSAFAKPWRALHERSGTRPRGGGQCRRGPAPRRGGGQVGLVEENRPPVPAASTTLRLFHTARDYLAGGRPVALAVFER